MMSYTPLAFYYGKTPDFFNLLAKAYLIFFKLEQLPFASLVSAFQSKCVLSARATGQSGFLTKTQLASLLQLITSFTAMIWRAKISRLKF